ncbi:unnamed protein product [Amoebophrya sp. A120]|nr:unnamed protein product [Amoebophrya sp. A120]|eukprot:GSA120T00024319001.1
MSDRTRAGEDHLPLAEGSHFDLARQAADVISHLPKKEVDCDEAEKLQDHAGALSNRTTADKNDTHEDRSEVFASDDVSELQNKSYSTSSSLPPSNKKLPLGRTTKSTSTPRMKPWILKKLFTKQDRTLAQAFPANLLTDAITVVQYLKKKKDILAKFGPDWVQRIESAIAKHTEFDSIAALGKQLEQWRVEAQTVGFNADAYYTEKRVAGYTAHLTSNLHTKGSGSSLCTTTGGTTEMKNEAAAFCSTSTEVGAVVADHEDQQDLHCDRQNKEQHPCKARKLEDGTAKGVGASTGKIKNRDTALLPVPASSFSKTRSGTRSCTSITCSSTQLSVRAVVPPPVEPAQDTTGSSQMALAQICVGCLNWEKDDVVALEEGRATLWQDWEMKRMGALGGKKIEEQLSEEKMLKRNSGGPAATVSSSSPVAQNNFSKVRSSGEQIEKDPTKKMNAKINPPAPENKLITKNKREAATEGTTTSSSPHDPAKKSSTFLVADFGCGTGLSSHAFPANSFVLGVDGSSAMLNRCTLGGRYGGDRIFADLSQGVPFRANVLDAAISVACVHYLCVRGPDDRPGEERVRRLLDYPIRDNNYCYQFFKHGDLTLDQIAAKLLHAARKGEDERELGRAQEIEEDVEQNREDVDVDQHLPQTASSTQATTGAKKTYPVLVRDFPHLKDHQERMFLVGNSGVGDCNFPYCKLFQDDQLYLERNTYTRAVLDEGKCGLRGVEVKENGSVQPLVPDRIIADHEKPVQKCGVEQTVKFLQVEYAEVSSLCQLTLLQLFHARESYIRYKKCGAIHPEDDHKRELEANLLLDSERGYYEESADRRKLRTYNPEPARTPSAQKPRTGPPHRLEKLEKSSPCPLTSTSIADGESALEADATSIASSTISPKPTMITVTGLTTHRQWAKKLVEGVFGGEEAVKSENFRKIAAFLQDHFDWTVRKYVKQVSHFIRKVKHEQQRVFSDKSFIKVARLDTAKNYADLLANHWAPIVQEYHFHDMGEFDSATIAKAARVRTELIKNWKEPQECQLHLWWKEGRLTLQDPWDLFERLMQEQTEETSDQHGYRCGHHPGHHPTSTDVLEDVREEKSVFAGGPQLQTMAQRRRLILSVLKTLNLNYPNSAKRLRTVKDETLAKVLAVGSYDTVCG